MATITASAQASSFTRAGCTAKTRVGISPPSSLVLGLPAMAKKVKVQCLADQEKAVATSTVGASLMAAACALSVSPPALALVDERMSTEGTGLSLGISNNLLGWILLGVFGLIWSLYIVYTSSLEEDEDSALEL